MKMFLLSYFAIENFILMNGVIYLCQFVLIIGTFLQISERKIAFACLKPIYGCNGNQNDAIKTIIIF